MFIKSIILYTLTFVMVVHNVIGMCMTLIYIYPNFPHLRYCPVPPVCLGWLLDDDCWCCGDNGC